MKHGERGLILRGVGVAVATEVGGDAAVAKGGEVEELMAPSVPELGEAMEEEDGGRRRTTIRRASLGYVHVDAIDAQSRVLDCFHGHRRRRRRKKAGGARSLLRDGGPTGN